MSWKKIMVLLVGLAAIAVVVPVSAGAATHYFSQTKIVQVIANTSGRAACPHGWHVTGGGVENGSASITGPIQVENSYPYVNPSNHNQSWNVTVVSPGGTPLITVFADCAS